MCRRKGELFANFEPYDVQETRRIARAEGREEGIQEGIKEGIKKLVKVMRNLGSSQEMAAKQLEEQYDLPEAEAIEIIRLYW